MERVAYSVLVSNNSRSLHFALQTLRLNIPLTNLSRFDYIIRGIDTHRKTYVSEQRFIISQVTSFQFVVLLNLNIPQLISCQLNLPFKLTLSGWVKLCSAMGSSIPALSSEGQHGREGVLRA
jgi:hypothetical protein